jgi:hypothetical protein
MNKSQLLKKAGGASALAALLGVSRQAVYKWSTVPPLQLYRLRELRPEWFTRKAKA